MPGQSRVRECETVGSIRQDDELLNALQAAARAGYANGNTAARIARKKWLEQQARGERGPLVRVGRQYIAPAWYWRQLLGQREPGTRGRPRGR